MYEALLRWKRARGPIFWIFVGVFLLCFLAILTAESYKHGSWQARWGNAFGAGLTIGGIVAGACWLIKKAFQLASKAISSSSKSDSAKHEEIPAETSISSALSHMTLTLEQPTVDQVATAELFRLHPSIREAISGLWRDGHYRQAVEQAARATSRRAQEKTGRVDATDDRLIQDLFSENGPAAGHPRLRFPGDPTTEAWQNRMRGARAFSQGCYAGIRNIAAHEYSIEWSRDICLEYLTAFSILARWIDECYVLRID